jgi:hypothetical protein
MLVCVTLLEGEDDTKPTVVLAARGIDGKATFEHETHLGAGVRLAVDLAQPYRWRRLSVTYWSAAARPLVAAIIGHQATKDLSAVIGHDCMPITNKSLVVDSTGAAPWLRVAVADALDRWLHLPLEQALLDAERAVARFRATLSLPSNAGVRKAVIDEALGLARRSSVGVSRFLRKLAIEDRPIPRFLHRSIRDVVQGYVELATQVSEPDSDLSVALDDWDAVSRRLQIDGSLRQRSQPHTMLRRAVESAAETAPVVSMIDPRHVWARVLGLGDHPGSSEITLSRTSSNGQDAVLVRVPAFKGGVDPEISQRLIARLVDRRSGEAHSFAPLNLPSDNGTPSRPRPTFFECTMPLRGSPVEDLRADVYDALFGDEFAVEDTEKELEKVRRAVLFLREWRALVALSQVQPSISMAPRLYEMAKLLHVGGLDTQPDQPLFEAGPSIADVNQLATQSEAGLLGHLREPMAAPGDALFAMVGGPAKPLLAELAAAYQVKQPR